MTQNHSLNPSPISLVISVAGPDASKFLQGQLSCDVTALEDGHSTLGAYCNIKGKVEALFTLVRSASTYYLHLPETVITATFNELRKYAVFSKVELSTIEQDSINQNDEQAILAKIPEIYPETIGLFFPHDLNLPALKAVSFTKGCFRGQEIIARMQHRGNLKRSLQQFSANINSINPGDLVTTGAADNTTVAGTVVRTCLNNNGETMGLAVITDTMLQLPLYVGVPPVKLQLLLS